MSVSTTPPKGQIVIPVELRRRFKIEPGTKVSIQEGDGCIVVRPIGRGRAEDFFGVLKHFPGGSTVAALRRERRRERRR